MCICLFTQYWLTNWLPFNVLQQICQINMFAQSIVMTTTTTECKLTSPRKTDEPMPPVLVSHVQRGRSISCKYE